MASTSYFSSRTQQLTEDAMTQLVKRCRQLELENKELKRQNSEQWIINLDLRLSLEIEQKNSEMVIETLSENDAQLNDVYKKYDKMKGQHDKARDSRRKHIAASRNLKQELVREKDRTVILESIIKQLQQQLENPQTNERDDEAELRQKILELTHKIEELQDDLEEVECAGEIALRDANAWEHKNNMNRMYVNNLLEKSGENAQIVGRLSNEVRNIYSDLPSFSSSNMDRVKNFLVRVAKVNDDLAYYHRYASTIYGPLPSSPC